MHRTRYLTGMVLDVGMGDDIALQENRVSEQIKSRGTLRRV